jgi:hypothetical protein
MHYNPSKHWDIFTSQHNIKTMRLESSAHHRKNLKIRNVQSLWGFNSSWTHHITGQSVPDIVKQCCDLIFQGWNVQEENLHTIIFSINLSCPRYKLRIHVSICLVHLSNYLPHWMNVLHTNTQCSKKKVLSSSHSKTMNMRHPLF